MRITLWIVSQQSIPFFTTYKMIRLFSLYFSHSLLRDDRPPLNLSEKALLPWGILMEHCIDRIAKLSFPSEAITSISTKKSLHLSTFSFTFYLSASSRSIQPRHINIISTSFYFIFHYSSRFISYAFFHHLYQAFTSSNSLHYTTFLYILFFVSFHLLLKFHHAKWFTFFYPTITIILYQ